MTNVEIRRLLKEIGRSPKILKQLLAAKTDAAKKKVLVTNGLLKAGEKGPTQAAIMKEIKTLLPAKTPTGRTGKGGASGGQPERVVDWVIAVATAGSGAAAAACVAD